MRRITWVFILFSTYVIFIMVHELVMLSDQQMIRHFHNQYIIVDNAVDINETVRNSESPFSYKKEDHQISPSQLDAINKVASNWIPRGALMRILTFHLPNEEEWNTREAIDHNKGW